MRAAGDQIHRLRPALLAGTLLMALGLAPAARASVPQPPPGAVKLSNERTYTRWAYGLERVPIRRSPYADATVVTHLRLRTEDGPTEVYLLLRSWTDQGGRDWLQVRIPGRPNGRTGWVHSSALGRPHLVLTQLVVNRHSLRATLFRGGRRIWRAPVGVGKASTPTPAGRFWIRERLHAHFSGGAYGPWAFGTAAYSRLSDWPGGGVIGIHGTNEPGLIPGRPSHGCIRVRNGAIRRLARRMPIGTPLRIR
jgi:hypothetical protein